MVKMDVVVGDIRKSVADAVILLENTILPGGDKVPADVLAMSNLISEPGPVWKDGESSEIMELKKSYTKCLESASSKKCKSADLMAVSAGDYSSSLFQIATTTFAAIKEYTDEHDCLESMCIVCQNQTIANAYKQVYNFWYAAEKSDRLGSEDWEDWKKQD